MTGLEAVEESQYRRVIDWNGRVGWVGADFVASGAATLVGSPVIPARQACHAVARIFDLGTDLAPFVTMARSDRLLGPLVRKRPGLRRVLVPHPFEAGIRAIVGQLISVVAASTIVTRLVRALGRPVPGPPDGLAFPSAEQILERRGAIGRIGLTKTKVAAMTALAQRTVDRPTLWKSLARDPAAVDRSLADLPGVGPWTRAYIGYRGLADPDAFLPTDLGIVKAMGRLGVPRSRIETAAERWRPWRAFAVPHLWASLAD